MKRFTLLILLFTAFSILAQDKFRTSTAIVNFEASVPLFEEIKAVNKLGTIVIETKTSEFVCVLFIKDFTFKLDLMKQHFNENYLESDRYPKAVFKGRIAKFDVNEITDLEKEYQIKGKLYLHGKSKNIEVKAFMKKVSEGIQITSDFPIIISDFDIEVPYTIAGKIAKTVNTELTAVVECDGCDTKQIVVVDTN